MISERSCDTEDWSNEAENSVLHQIKELHLKYIKIEKLFKIVIIFYNITLFLVLLDQINAVLVSRIYFFQKHKKTYPSLYLFICILLYILI